MRKLRPNNRGTDRVAGRDFPAATRPSVNRTRDCLTSLIEDFYTNRRIFSRKIFRTSRRHPIQMPPRGYVSRSTKKTSILSEDAKPKKKHFERSHHNYTFVTSRRNLIIAT